MKKKQADLIYALKNWRTVHISEVESGLKCGCVCPCCKEQLVAKKGNKMIHHFSHSKGTECKYGYETSLHYAAKEIISKYEKFTIPRVNLTLNPYKSNEIISEAKEIKVDKVTLEQRCGDIIPDVIIYSGGKELLVEIFVTHKVDEQKIEKIKNMNISAIEIDLSGISNNITIDELSNLIINETKNKYWLYNALINKYEKAFDEASETLQFYRIKQASYIRNCPINIRNYKGSSYAVFEFDCKSCDYLIDYSLGRYIKCSGRRKIAKTKDLVQGS